MKCPKCNNSVPDNATVCPHCHKVFLLECPNCHALSDVAVCEKCGYILLIKCAKCGKSVSTSKDKCKCGFPIHTSIAYNECENDEFSAISVQFLSLQKIRHLLGSQELFTKFYFKLRNLLVLQLKDLDATVINYNDAFVINMNKELSFPTSAAKALRLAIKIVNSFAEINTKLQDELSIPLKLNVTVMRKKAEELLEYKPINSNVKLLSVKKNEKKHLRGLQITLDQFVWECIKNDYKTDSLYSIEADGQTLMFYEIMLEDYVIPPSAKQTDEPEIVKENKIVKNEKEQPDDIYSFKVFDINAKCQFKKIKASTFFDNFEENKIVAIRTQREWSVNIADLVHYYEKQSKQVLHVICSEETNFKAWGVFTQLFREYYNLSLHKELIPNDFSAKHFQTIIDLIKNKARKASTPEDARFAYIEDFCTFFKVLKNCVIIFEGFEFMDDTSIQTLNLYFDRFRNIVPQFVFITTSENAVHSKIKGLLRTPLYTEYSFAPSNIDSILSTIKEEASDFIQSFFFEKIKDNYDGSLLYFQQALNYLKEKDILINFNDRLIIKNNSSIVLPTGLDALYKARLKGLSTNMDASMILAFASYLGGRLDFALLEKLGIKDIASAVKTIEESGFAYAKNNVIYLNNYHIVSPVILDSIKPKVNEFLSKTILSTIGKGLDDTETCFILGKLSLFKEEYLLLWKNSQFAMSTGDYDAYLKNCLSFLSLLEHVGEQISEEEIEQNKKEVYQNILMSLYGYSPEKIYSIENMLLLDALNQNNDEKITKLSNLMLQGALITSNYTDALSLLRNILERMENPILVVNGEINTKFLLLSLVNIEILFNIGDLTQCVEVAQDLLSVLKPLMLEEIKPASFSIHLFMEHLMETFRLTAFAKLFLMDDDLEDFLQAIQKSLGESLPDAECILTVKEFLSGKPYTPSNTEYSSPFSKIIYLILQEMETHQNDYKTFAQNIYQAKLLATEIHQPQLEMFCELLIAYAYANIGIEKKAITIYNDILTKSETSAIFNIYTLANYFIARLKISKSEYEEALYIINDVLALMQKKHNESKIIYVLFEQLLIETVEAAHIESIDITNEAQKLLVINKDGCLTRILG